MAFDYGGIFFLTCFHDYMCWLIFISLRSSPFPCISEEKAPVRYFCSWIDDAANAQFVPYADNWLELLGPNIPSEPTV